MPVPAPKISKTGRLDAVGKDSLPDAEKKRPFITAPVILPVPLISPQEMPASAAALTAKAERPACATPEAMATSTPLPILEVHIHSQTADSATAPPAEAVPPAAVKPSSTQTPMEGQANSDHGQSDARPAPIRIENKLAVEAQPRSADVPEVTATVAHTKIESPALAPVTAEAPPAIRDVKPAPTVSSALPVPEPAPAEPKAQAPMRTLALEFTPDGAHDIKVRLSEHSGDVHVSLHGTDPVLAGRVREGMSDLVGALSKAGYDAHAWSPGQGGQSSRRPPEQEKAGQRKSSASTEEFSGMLQIPIEEIA